MWGWLWAFSFFTIFMQKRKMHKHHFFSYVKIPTCTVFPRTHSTCTVNHPSTPKHVPSSHGVTVSSASIPSDIVQALRGYEIKWKRSGQCLSILSEPPSLCIQKQRAALNFADTRFKEDHFSSLHPCLWRWCKKERTRLFPKESSKQQRDMGGGERTLPPNSKKEKKVKQGRFFFLACKKSLEAWL